MTVYVKHYQKDGETKAVILESPNQYTMLARSEKGKLKDIHVFDGDKNLAAKYIVEGHTMRAESKGTNSFGGAFQGNYETSLESDDHSHLYLGTMHGGSPFDMSWSPRGRLTFFFGENDQKTIGKLCVDWNGKMNPQIIKDDSQASIQELNYQGDGSDNFWVKKLEGISPKKGLTKRLSGITLEKKAEVLDKEVEGQRKDDEKFIREYLEVDAQRYGRQKDLKKQIMKVKDKTEKKRFEKYKKMSAQKLSDPEVQKKLAEVRAKKEGR